MRFAYADPPYVGQARKHYGPDAKEVNHEMLIAHLMEYDGWALSCSEPSLRKLLPMTPEGTRTMPWVKPFASFKPGVRVAYAWEPVLVYGMKELEGEMTVRDWHSANITLQRGTHGAKPDTFCWWLFEVWGMGPADELIDVFPGSGAVARAWEAYRSQARFNLTGAA